MVFFQPGQTIESAVKESVLAVRNSLGIMDASTLGKIDVQGKDALNFLERIYTHDVSKMEIGQCAYGIMLGEDGMIKDDGVMTRVAENHFFLTTTTGGAATVMGWLRTMAANRMARFGCLSDVTDRMTLSHSSGRTQQQAY